jgi:hypothetical protein
MEGRQVFDQKKGRNSVRKRSAQLHIQNTETAQNSANQQRKIESRKTHHENSACARLPCPLLSPADPKAIVTLEIGAGKSPVRSTMRTTSVVNESNRSEKFAWQLNGPRKGLKTRSIAG